jgi:polysaccharide pyruvyl transferase WcaK-like protein
MKEIVLVGGFGFQDLGDEAQLTTSLINLKKLIPDAHFIALSDNPKYTREYHKIESKESINSYLFAKSRIYKRFPRLVFAFRTVVLLFNAERLRKNKNSLFLNATGKNLLNILKNADLLYNVGGGNLTSKWRFGGLYSKCTTYVLCRMFETPVILSGQTVGPFYGRLDRFIARFALNRVNLITLREKISRRILKQIGVVKPVIKVTADDATLLPANERGAEEVLSFHKIVGHRPLVAMNMVELKILSEAKKRKSQKLMAEIADHIISKYDARILFIPMQYAASADDRTAAFKILKLMKQPDKADVITQECDDQTLKAIIKQADLAIGLRYHFIVFAVNSRVPAIGMYLDDYYSIKIRGILTLVAQEKYACHIDKTSLQNLIKLTQEILSNKELICRKLEERTKDLEKRSLLSSKCAARLLHLKN